MLKCIGRGNWQSALVDYSCRVQLYRGYFLHSFKILCGHPYMRNCAFLNVIEPDFLITKLQISQHLPVQQTIEEIWIGSIIGWLFGWFVNLSFVVMLLGLSKSSHLSQGMGKYSNF